MGIACYGDAMCGRFTQRYTWDEIEDLYGLMGAARNLQAHYNIAPTDTVDVVTPAHDGTNGLEPGDFATWLAGAGGIELLRPAADNTLRMWPVSRRVNRTGSGDDDPTLPDEVAA